MGAKYVKVLDLPFIAEDRKTILNLIAKRVDNEEIGRASCRERV